MRLRPLAGVLLLLAWSSLAAAADDVVTGLLVAEPSRAVVELTIASGWHVNAHEPRDPFLIPTTATFVPPEGVRVGDVGYPAPVERKLAFSDKPLVLYEGRVTIAASLDGTATAGSSPLRATVRYQACDDSRCLPPRTLDLVAAPPRSAIPAPALAAAAPLGGGDVAGWVAQSGWAVTFLWVALLGLALNLTPCVYPLISVTVAFFGGTTGRGGRPVRAACVYVLGICLTFSALGVAAALTGSMFGAALQRPAVLIGIATLLVLLAASNLGLWTFRMPSALVQRAGRVGEGTIGAFLMGLTMGVVAAPCIGPIVVALLLFVGARQSVPLGFALFFTLAVGMGAPYVALAAVAGRLRRLPRSGAWLEWVERAFAFVLVGLAIHFLTPLLRPETARASWAFLFVAAGIVLGFLTPGRGVRAPWLRQLAGLAAIVLALGWLFTRTEAAPAIAWAPYSDAALAEAAAARKPVFIDFGAEWCLPCREMERTTFRDPDVVRAAASFATLKVDATETDDRVQAILDRYAIPGVPSYVLLGPDGRERGRLTGFVAPDAMVKAMSAVLPPPAAGLERG